MADNLTTQSSTPATVPSGAIISTDDLGGGIQVQRVKVQHGADGSATDVSSASPMPVVQTGTPALPTDASTETTLGTRLSESDFDTKVGSLTETAPASDTASAGLNGRLQRIAQRLTSLIALLPSALVSGRLDVNLGGVGSVAVPVTDNSGSLTVDGTVAATQSGTWNVGTVTTVTNVVHVDDNSGSLTVDGTVGITETAQSTSHLVTAASANATSVKASAGKLRGIQVFNKAAYPIYVKFHNTASTPTAGSGVVYGIGVQAGTQVNFLLPGGGRSFSTGIGMTVVQDITDAGTTAVASGDALIEVLYE